MTEVPDRVGRAFRDHESFERVGEGSYESQTTAFDGVVDVAAAEGRIAFDVTVRVPMLSAVVDGEVAGVVEDGWYETFELRVRDANGVVRGDHDLDPTVRRRPTQAIVEYTFEDINERRGVDDAGALVNYVEGTYAQGIIPGYDYLSPVTDIVSRASQNTSGGPL
jgi:hypothetical protein